MKKFNKNKAEYTVDVDNLEIMKDIYIEMIEEKSNEIVNPTNELNVLGTIYKLETTDDKNFEYGGLIDFKTKIIKINKKSSFQTKDLYHEIIHAFLFESGLHSNSEWATNEEMVDWFAMQFDKMVGVSRKGVCYLNEDKVI